MATSEKKMLLLCLVVTILAIVAMEASVTVYNPGKLLVDVLVDNKEVKVGMDVVNVDIAKGNHKIQVKTKQGHVVDVDVKDGDVVVLIPDPSGVLEPIKVQVFNNMAPFKIP